LRDDEVDLAGQVVAAYLSLLAMSPFVHRGLLFFVPAVLLITGENAFLGIRLKCADALGSLAGNGTRLTTKGDFP